MDRRAFLIAGVGSAMSLATGSASAEPTSTNLGLLLYSCGIRAKAEQDRQFSEPIPFLKYARQQGATAVQLPLGIRSQAEATEIRRVSDELQMTIEGIVSPPKVEQTDVDRFTSELTTARNCGASVVRTVLLGGRRYEVFNQSAEFTAFAARAEDSLKRAERIAKEQQMILAVENHKDFRTDELVDLLKRISSDWVGVCLDTGNNLALLEDPHAVVEALAPWTRTVHLKDIGLEESGDGFFMSEVPLGQGRFDLARMTTLIHKANPKACFLLEMITRNPLSIPCLTDKYWETLGQVPGRDLARAMARVRSAPKTTLPRITTLAAEAQLATEDQNIRDSFAYAVRTKLIP